MTTPKTLNNGLKSESIAEKHRRYEVAIKFWNENKHLTRVEIAEKFGFTPSAMRSFMRKHNIDKPNGFTISNQDGRKAVVRDAYNMGLDNDMTATEVASWASKKHGVRIGRSEIQFYATKFDLPYLREDKNFEIGKLCKYA